MLVKLLSIIILQFLIQSCHCVEFEFPPSSKLFGFQMDQKLLILEEDFSNKNNIGDPLLRCAFMCGNGCRVFEFENGICRLYENFLVKVSANSNQVIEARMKHLRGSQNLQNVLMGPEILVFRQDSSDEIFWPQDVIALNKENTSALRYSILDEISNLRRKDGSFHFKLCYPDLYPDVCFRWSQTEDPLVVPGQEIPKGFVYKEGPQPKYHGFFGLSRSTRQNCLLDADLSSPTRWWFALGTFKSFRGADTFPGPDEIVVSLVELYIEL